MKFKIAILVLLSVNLSFGKIYSKCDLAKELSTYPGMDYEEIQNWVCIARITSGFDSLKLIHDTSDDHWSHGIFLISDRWWCSHGEDRPEPNQCGVPCKELSSDNITESINCARHILKEWNQPPGYKAWSGWYTHCKNNLPDLKGCSLGPL